MTLLHDDRRRQTRATAFGVHDGEELVAHWRLTTRREQTASEYGVLHAQPVRRLVEPRQDIGGVALASVVPG